STLTLLNVSALDAGVYTLDVAGACSNATATATLTVLTNTTVAAIADQTVCPGTLVTFTAVASGTGPFTYQWRKGATVVGTSNVLTLTNVSALDAALYTVDVVGACSNATRSAILTVLTNTSVAAVPDQTVCPGATVTFTAIASGTGPFTYQWRKGVTVVGANSVLTLSNVSAADAAVYTVSVVGACSNATTSATLTGLTNTTIAPITSQTVCPGATVTFAAVASGTGPFTYQWRKGATVVGTSNVLTLTNVTALDAGLYTIDVAGACSNATTSATLIVLTNTSVAVIPDQTVCPGNLVTFTANASGSGPFTYQWRKGATLVGTTNVLTLPNVSATDAGVYTVSVIGACSNATATATLTVL